MGLENRLENLSSLPDNQRLKQFIEKREINPEDFKLIQQLIELAQSHKNDLIASFHNYFHVGTYSKEQVLDRLKTDLKRVKEGNREEYEVKFYELFIELTEKYDHFVAYHLERVLEEL